MKPERVVENLNRALHELFAADGSTFLIGEDVLDPYGGAFKVAKGLSSRFPDRVLTTPISEASIVGVANGLALMGQKPIAEMMFGDFIALGFDQIVNFAAKSVTMYGRRLALNMLVRCPVGAGRGYGPTHSQSLQKHFVGVPNLDLFELSPLHDNVPLLPRLLSRGNPALLFEDKVLYTQSMYRDGQVDDLFTFHLLDGEFPTARVTSDAFGGSPCVIIAPGGVFHRCLAAARNVFLEREIECEILVPSRLHPFDLSPLVPLLSGARNILIVEEAVEGGTWGADVAQQIYRELWGRLRRPIRLVHSRSEIIPSSYHLEKQVVVQAEHIQSAIQAEVSLA